MDRASGNETLSTQRLRDLPVSTPGALGRYETAYQRLSRNLKKFYEQQKEWRNQVFERRLQFYKICETYDKFCNFINFLPGTISKQLQNYFLPVFMHIHLHLKWHNKDEADKFFNTYFSQFVQDRNKYPGLEDLRKIEKYASVMRHFDCDFRYDKYVINLSHSSNVILTTWLKENKLKYLETVIVLHISVSITIACSKIGKYMVSQLQGTAVQDDKRSKVGKLSLDSIIGADTGSSSSLHLNIGSATERRQVLPDPIFLNPPFINYLRERQAALYEDDTSSVTSTESSPLQDWDEGQMPNCPEETAEFMESEPQPSCSYAEQQDILELPFIGSNETYSSNSKENLQSNAFSSNEKNVLKSHNSNEPHTSYFSDLTCAPNVPSDNTSSIMKTAKPNIRCEPYSASSRQDTQLSTSSNGESLLVIHSPTAPVLNSTGSSCLEGPSSRLQSLSADTIAVLNELRSTDNAARPTRRSSSSRGIVSRAPVEKAPEVCLLTVTDASEYLTSADIAEDGTYVFGGFSNLIRGWDIQHKIETEMADVQRFTSDGGSSIRGRIETDKRTVLLQGHAGVVNGISYSAKEKILFSCSEDETVKLWKISDQTCMKSFFFHRDAVIDVCSSSSPGFFASASADRTAALWNCNYNRPLLKLKHGGEVTCVIFHPYSPYLATGCDDEWVRLWSAADGLLVRVFDGTGKISSIAISPCGHYLSCGDVNGYVRIWHMISAQNLHSFSVHKNPIANISYNKAGTFLAVGGINGCLKIFNLSKLRTPVSREEDEASFQAYERVNYEGYNERYPLDLVCHSIYKERDVLGLSFVKNDLVIGLAGYTQL